jgi:hypothetical protein
MRYNFLQIQENISFHSGQIPGFTQAPNQWIPGVLSQEVKRPTWKLTNSSILMCSCITAKLNTRTYLSLRNFMSSKLVSQMPIRSVQMTVHLTKPGMFAI